MRLRLAVVLLAAACTGEEPAPVESSTAPTWHADIQPVMATECGACHLPGGVGPFALESYDDVKAVAPLALASMAEGRMPPWPADNACRTYHEAPQLDAAFVDTFEAWIAAEMPQGESTGDPVAAPVVATIEPTHVGAVPGYVSEAISGDEYRCFLLDIELPEVQYLQATQVIAGSPQVHHVLAYAVGADSRDALLAADAAHEGHGYSCFGSPLPDSEFVSLETVAGGFPNQIGAWVPGLEPARQSPGDAIRITAGSTIVLQVHYSALSGDPEPDHTELQLILSEEQPTNLVRTVPLLIPNLDIPPGRDDVRFTDLFKAYGPDPVQITSFTAHMHLLGSGMQVQVERADDTEECGLDIPAYDFNWQRTYILSPDDPLVLQQGDGLELTCVYDNSAENQPVVDGEQVAPRQVGWGDGTLDEMCLLYLSTVQPFTPLPDPDDKPCTNTEQCVEDCGDEPTADCLMRCPQADADCAVCMLDEGYGCGFTPCALGFLLNQECITSCLITTLMFGGSPGECLADKCAEQFDPFVECARDTVASGECDDEMRRCGWAL